MMNIVQIHKNHILISETTSLFILIENTLLPINIQFINSQKDALQKLKEEYMQKKASTQIEFYRELASGASKMEAYEISNLRSMKERFYHEESELITYYNQLKVHSTMYIVVLIQSHIEAMLMVLCRIYLTSDEFKHVSKKRQNVIIEYLRALKLHSILSNNRFCIIKKFSQHRNKYIHDQYDLKSANEEDERISYPELKLSFTQTEFERYIQSAKWLLSTAYEDVKKVS